MLLDLSRALSREWERINLSVFGGSLMEPPTIVVASRLHHHAADWNPGSRTIRFSRDFVNQRPWWVVIEVLKHEMAHQYVSDVLGISDEETAHGETFRMVCRRYGIDGRAGHKPTEQEQRIVDKVRKLLALGTSPNKHEAQAALAAARRLLGQHGLLEEDVRERDSQDFGASALGEVIPKPELHHNFAATLLASHFRVRPIWINVHDPRTGTFGFQLEVVGQRSDLAMAEYVHQWVHRLADRLCPPGLGAKARKDFRAGVIVGQKRRLDEEAAGDAADGSLAIMKGEMGGQALADYFDRRHPTARSKRGSRRSITASFYDGESKGRAAALRKPLGESTPKLLKGR